MEQMTQPNESIDVIAWHVGDQAYAWYPRKQCNARDLKGSIIIVQLLEEVRTCKWKARILLSGYTTRWAHKGAIIYVTADELYPSETVLINELENRYRRYLEDQIDLLAKRRSEIDDPS